MKGWGGIRAEAETAEFVALFGILIISPKMFLWLNSGINFLEKIFVYWLINEKLYNTEAYIQDGVLSLRFKMIYIIFISGKILRPVADSTYKILKTKRVKNRFKQAPFYKKPFFFH